MGMVSDDNDEGDSGDGDFEGTVEDLEEKLG